MVDVMTIKCGGCSSGGGGLVAVVVMGGGATGDRSRIRRFPFTSGKHWMSGVFIECRGWSFEVNEWLGRWQTVDL